MKRTHGPLSDEKTQQRLKQRQQTASNQAAKDIRFLLSSEQGRRFMFRLLDQVTAVFSGSFHASGSVTAFNEGRRSVGIDLMRECQAMAPVDYVHMLAERFGTQASEAELKKELEASAETEE